jgi:hypothetical protein
VWVEDSSKEIIYIGGNDLLTWIHTRVVKGINLREEPNLEFIPFTQKNKITYKMS